MRRTLFHTVLPFATFAAVGLFGLALTSRAQEPTPDVVSRLRDQLVRGELKLDYKDKFGYLESLLKALDINPDSQVFVFSKTSLQQEYIGPKTPRALYFNDTVTVGYVQGAPLMELTVAAADKGIHFYTMEVKQQEPPKINSDRGLCIICHNNAFAAHTFVENTYPATDGTPAFLGGDLFHVTDDRTPFEERWGGWYVSGTHGKMQHLGNAVAPDPFKPVELETENTMNQTSLASKFDTSKYLRPNSDIVALLTLEHQTRAIYYMAALSEQFRIAASAGKINVGVDKKQLDAGVENLVSFLTYAEEVPLPDPVKGVSTFTDTFPKRGPRDAKGRSLRDFNLKTRVFEYPLSYTIYTDVFDNMNPQARDRVLRRLYEVLSGQEQNAPFSSISPERRKAALEILLETKPNLPDYFRQTVNP